MPISVDHKLFQDLNNEMFTFGRIDCTVRKLGGFCVAFAIRENAGVRPRKTAFCPATEYL